MSTAFNPDDYITKKQSEFSPDNYIAKKSLDLTPVTVTPIKTGMRLSDAMAQNQTPDLSSLGLIPVTKRPITNAGPGVIDWNDEQLAQINKGETPTLTDEQKSSQIKGAPMNLSPDAKSAIIAGAFRKMPAAGRHVLTAASRLDPFNLRRFVAEKLSSHIAFGSDKVQGGITPKDIYAGLDRYQSELKFSDPEKYTAIGSSIGKVAAEFANLPMKAATIPMTAAKFALQEAVQLPVSEEAKLTTGEFLKERAKNTAISAATGAVVGGAGKVIPKPSVRIPVVTAGFAGAAAAQAPEGQRANAAIESAITVLGFEAVGLAQKGLFKQAAQKATAFNPELKKVDPVELENKVKAISPVKNFVVQDVVPAANNLFSNAQKTIDAVKSIINPAGFSKAQATKTAMRSGLGEMEANNRRAEASLTEAKTFFDKQNPQSNLDFINSMETGTPLQDPKLNKFAGTLRTLLDDARDTLRKNGRLSHYIDNYFPHIWEDPTKATQVFAGKRPISGSKAFLKQRTIPTVQEGIDLGLKPVSTNPVELSLIRLQDMNKLIMADNLTSQLKAAKDMQFVAFGQKAPDGWVQINDPIGKVYQHSDAEGGMVHRGNYYMPAEAARLINNYLSPGLRGKGWYEMMREPGNLLNQIQLGLSGFHFTFVSVDAAISNISLGVQKLSTPGFRLEGLKDIAKSAVPVYNQFRTYKEGANLYREYLKPVEQQSPELKPYIQAIEKSNAAVRQDMFYKNRQAGISGFGQAMKNGNPIGALLRLPGAIIEAQSKPLMDNYVPNIKMGAFMKQADFILRQSKAENWTKDKVNARLQEASDSIDNRMGQLKYDNLFWNKTLKDLGMLSVRSLGWNLGTIRELGGGVSDVRKIITEGRLTPRYAYTITLPIVIGAVGALTQYIMSGKKPGEGLDNPQETYKDYYFPRTGRTLPDGNPERISMPSYMKDVFAYAHSPSETVGHKIHPLGSMIIDMLNNKDYYGTEIRNPDDPIVQQIGQEMKYIATNWTPFTFRNLSKLNESGESPARKIMAFGGVTPAPKYITNTPAQNDMAEILKGRRGTTPISAEQAAQNKAKGELKSQFRQGQISSKEVVAGASALDLTRQQTKNILKSKSTTPLIDKFEMLSVDDAKKVYDDANEKEKAVLALYLARKIFAQEKNAVNKKGTDEALQNVLEYIPDQEIRREMASKLNQDGSVKKGQELSIRKLAAERSRRNKTKQN